MRKPPSKKQPAEGEEKPKKPRTVNGFALDVRTGSAFCGWSEKTSRAMIERGVIPYRRRGGRIIFIKSELEAWLQGLEGCTLAEARANQEARHDA